VPVARDVIHLVSGHAALFHFLPKHAPGQFPMFGRDQLVGLSSHDFVARYSRSALIPLD